MAARDDLEQKCDLLVNSCNTRFRLCICINKRVINMAPKIPVGERFFFSCPKRSD